MGGGLGRSGRKKEGQIPRTVLGKLGKGVYNMAVHSGGRMSRILSPIHIESDVKSRFKGPLEENGCPKTGIFG